MSTIIVSLEYKENGFVSPQGPGDSLRLAHCLRHPKLRDSRKILIAPKNHRLNGLITYSKFVPTHTTKTNSPTGELKIDDLKNRIMDCGIELSIGDQIVHTFIGDEKNKDPWENVQWVINDIPVTRWRIDSSKRPATSLLFWKRWQPTKHSFCNKRILAVAIRNSNNFTYRDTPEWFIDLCRKVARENGFAIIWYGNTDHIKGEKGEVFLRFGNKSFSKQITDLRSNAFAATGWNSGALDLAAAAGLPILRVGEFQDGGAYYISSPTKKKNDWGRLYNSYLACSTNIGLAPEFLESDRFPSDVLHNSLQVFLKNIECLRIPRHVILPVGVPLESNLTELKKQLCKHTVVWPD